MADVAKNTCRSRARLETYRLSARMAWAGRRSVLAGAIRAASSHGVDPRRGEPRDWPHPVLWTEQTHPSMECVHRRVGWNGGPCALSAFRVVPASLIRVAACWRTGAATHEQAAGVGKSQRVLGATMEHRVP